jgi:uncharacterized protein YgbK (DUF1537 family)
VAQVEALRGRGVQLVSTAQDQSDSPPPARDPGAALLLVLAEHGRSHGRHGPDAEHELARAARRWLESGSFDGLVISGGETAGAICVELEATGLWLSRELEPGIPLGSLSGGDWDGLPVATKAGGFGQPETLSSMAAALTRKMTPRADQ